MGPQDRSAAGLAVRTRRDRHPGQTASPQHEQHFHRNHRREDPKEVQTYWTDSREGSRGGKGQRVTRT